MGSVATLRGDFQPSSSRRGLCLRKGHARWRSFGRAATGGKP